MIINETLFLRFAISFLCNPCTRNYRRGLYFSCQYYDCICSFHVICFSGSEDNLDSDDEGEEEGEESTDEDDKESDKEEESRQAGKAKPRDLLDSGSEGEDVGDILGGRTKEAKSSFQKHQEKVIYHCELYCKNLTPNLGRDKGIQSRCPRFAVHDEPCLVMYVANLEHEDGNPLSLPQCGD